MTGACLAPGTAAYSDAPMRDLPEQIDLARAGLGQSPAYRRRGVMRVRVPRGDIEVDVDMENTEDGVYLWGALLSAPGGVSERDGYHPFCTWEPLTRDTEAELFARFWAWLTGLRPARTRRAYAGDAVTWFGWLTERGRLMRWQPGGCA